MSQPRAQIHRSRAVSSPVGFLTVVAALLGAAGCATEGPPPATHPDLRTAAASRLVVAPAEQRPARTVVLVALDGVRPDEVFEGVDHELAQEQGLGPSEIVAADQLMPNLHWILATRGAAIGAPGVGEPMRATGPAYVSLPGYREIMTGRQHTDCSTNECGRLPGPSLADEFASQADVHPGEVAVFSSWPRLSRAATDGRELVVVSAGRRDGQWLGFVRSDPVMRELLARGERADAAPGHGWYRPDRHTAPLALRYLRRHQPRFLMLVLGDPDEQAHRDDYRAYLAALRYSDSVIGEIAVALSEMSAQGWPTLLMVTTDHGRSRHFTEHNRDRESGWVWLVAAGDGVTARGRVAAPSPRYLADIAPTIRSLAGLPRAHAEHADAGRVLTELVRPGDPRLARRR